MKSSASESGLMNSVLFTNTKLYKIGFVASDLCTFCKTEPESLTHLFYRCFYSRQFWDAFESYWYQLSNQQVRL